MRIDKRISEEEPKPSYTVNMIINAYNVIARSRRYEHGFALRLSLHDIKCYVESFDNPIDFELFSSCIFMIDDDFIEAQSKKV